MDPWLMGGIGTLIGGLLTALGSFLNRIMTTRADLQRQALLLQTDVEKKQRQEAIQEWKDLVDTHQRQLEFLHRQNADQGLEINKLYSEIKELHVAHGECQKESAELRGEIKLLQASVSLIQSGNGIAPQTPHEAGK